MLELVALIAFAIVIAAMLAAPGPRTSARVEAAPAPVKVAKQPVTQTA